MCGCENLPAIAQIGTLLSLYFGIHLYRRDMGDWITQGILLSLVFGIDVPAAISSLLIFSIFNVFRAIKRPKRPQLQEGENVRITS
jgi:hypothetical protein